MAINYEAMIQLYSWWQGKNGKKRVFVVIERRKDFDENNNLIPGTVALLEYQTTNVSYLPWNDMIKLVEEGNLNKITLEN